MSNGNNGVGVIFFGLGIVLSVVMFWVEDVNLYPIDKINLVLSGLIMFSYGMGIYLGGVAHD